MSQQASDKQKNTDDDRSSLSYPSDFNPSSDADPADFNQEPFDYPYGFKKRDCWHLYAEMWGVPMKRQKKGDTSSPVVDNSSVTESSDCKFYIVFLHLV